VFDRHLPVRLDLDQLKRQAKELLRGVRGDAPEAVALLREHHPRAVEPAAAKLADAQIALARFYGIPSWTRLVLACRMSDAIWRDDVAAVRDLVLAHPRLLHESVRYTDSNWGPPMSYAANLGRDAIVAMLRERGADDVQHAFERAVLQGRIETARRLIAMGARPMRGSVMGPCETLNPEGLAFLLESGAELADEHGDPLAPVALLLQTYSRGPDGKHRCLEIVAEHGVALPDTPVMALHRGRIDLLEAHRRRDPQLFARTWSHQEMYPPALGCSADESLGLHGTPLAGATLLHMAVDFDEIEIARWMIERGAEVDAPAHRDDDGFGGHTALFGCVVSQAYRCGLQSDGTFTRLLLDHGANPNARASLRKRLRFVADESVHAYRDVTPRSWGERFHDQDWVNRAAMELIAARGGGV
jgi:ankyrin repeat protein